MLCVRLQPGLYKLLTTQASNVHSAVSRFVRTQIVFIRSQGSHVTMSWTEIP